MLFRSVKVWKEKEKLSQTGGDYGKITTKCNMGFWTGSLTMEKKNKTKTLGRKLMKSEQGF